MAFSSKENQAIFEKATRTVNSVYSQFAELKQTAGEMAAYANKMDRDYFTPSEDEGRLVCTEVIYRVYDGVDGISFPLSMRAGRLTLAALELVEMAMQRRHFVIEATYIPMLHNKLLRGVEAIEAVKRVCPTLQDKGNHGDQLLSNS
jgi:hypothetical protein